MTTTVAQEYLKPVIEAATLLGCTPRESAVDALAALLDKINPQFPQAVIDRLDALRIVTHYGHAGTVEEFDILKGVFPDWSGSVRYKLTPTTLTWQWSSRHSGTYATIEVPFPTLLPLTFTVTRWSDMDNLDNHHDECPQRLDDQDDDWSDDCNCEAQIEQVAHLKVEDWDGSEDKRTATMVRDWLAQAVTDHVENLAI